MDEEMIIGKNPILTALRAGRPIHKIMISDQLQAQAAKDIQGAAKKTKAVIQRVPRKKLDQLSAGKHQGLIAFVSAYEYQSVDAILQRAEEKNELPLLLLLDELEDPHNLGAILRTADAVGAHGIVIPKHRAASLTETVAKASAGAIEHVPVARVTNMAQTIDELKEEQIWVVGTDEAGAEDYRTLDGQTAMALVIGNEGKGISRLVKDKCDWLVQLPMSGSISSLNASVAAALLMYEVYRKRKPLGDQ